MKFIMTKTWLITGASSGLGRLMTERLLSRGDRVVATVRHVWRIRPKGRRKPIPAEIAHPVGIASFKKGARGEWFRGWLHMTTQDYSERYDDQPDIAEEDL
jgi:NAD(P)-dependent dehydrogenase (short-subunit alcohol dehydrogenase family)